jgi:GWxTD domain-containing protein
VNDLDLAITQLRYIARDEELTSLEEAQTTEEKQDVFMEFWKKRDPNPNTPRNERMEEYYRRVAYADKEFSHHLEGWRTDMGMVFIIFGRPDDVDRHPFDVNEKPYEIWRYYGINYEFVFIDQSGFGDYRLITPIWEAWKRADIWGRY